MSFNMQQAEMKDELASRFNVEKDVTGDATNYANNKKELAKKAMRNEGVKTRGPGSGYNGQGFGTKR